MIRTARPNWGGFLRHGVIATLAGIFLLDTNFCILLNYLVLNLLVLCSTNTLHAGYTSSSKISNRNCLIMQNSYLCKIFRCQSTLQHSESIQSLELLSLTLSFQNNEKCWWIVIYWAGFITLTFFSHFCFLLQLLFYFFFW